MQRHRHNIVTLRELLIGNCVHVYIANFGKENSQTYGALRYRVVNMHSFVDHHEWIYYHVRHEGI